MNAIVKSDNSIIEGDVAGGDMPIVPAAAGGIHYPVHQMPPAMLAAISEVVAEVAKNPPPMRGIHPKQGWKYYTIGDLRGTIVAPLATRGVVVYPTAERISLIRTVSSGGTTVYLAEVEGQIVISNSEGIVSIPYVEIVQTTDPTRIASVAKSNALKSVLVALAGLPGTDQTEEDLEVRPAAPQKPQPQRPAAPRPAPRPAGSQPAR